MLQIVIIDGKDGLVFLLWIIRFAGNLIFGIGIGLAACRIGARFVARFQHVKERLIGFATCLSTKLDETPPDGTARLVDYTTVLFAIGIGEIFYGLAVNLVRIEPCHSRVNGLLQLF